ncbi:hypothetical protein ACO1O0_004838 [Amphichorda felina]
MRASEPIYTLLFLASLGSCQSSSDEGKYANLRPTNITGLAYFYYPWIGSYYNGTTTIHIEPEDYDDETECDTFTNGEPVEVSYEDSVLGILASDRYYSDPHPFEWVLRYYDKTTNITPTNFASGNSPVNDIETLQSLDDMAGFYSYDNDGPVWWKYDTTLVSDLVYAFSGFYNSSKDAGDLGPISFNYSSCHSSEPTLWGGYFLGPDHDVDGLNGASHPRISGRFDNSSVFLEITGTFKGVGYTDDKNDESTLGGAISIRFVGQIDGDRSDDMIPTHNDTPLWNPTLGYSTMLFDNYGYKSVPAR